MRVTPFLSVACACLIVLSAAPRRASALSGDPLLIGAVLSTTGAFAPLGEPEANALKLAETDINAHGGIGGRPITLQILDDEGKPDTAAQLATQLIGSHAVAIIGGTTSATTAAVARVTTAAGVLEVYPTPTALFWDSKNGVVKNIFETTPRNEIEVAALTTFAQKTWHAQKFAILHDENQVGVVGAAILTAEFAKRNLTTSANEAYPTDATDVTAQLGNIKSSGADTIVLWGASPALGIIARQIKQLGLTQHVISSTGILSDNFLKIAGSAADGIVPAGVPCGGRAVCVVRLGCARGCGPRSARRTRRDRRNVARKRPRVRRPL
jgi:branched-chain amino acid transport system substrate-binding protein